MFRSACSSMSPMFTVPGRASLARSSAGFCFHGLFFNVVLLFFYL